MRIGRYEVSSVVDARFAVDGGALFGVVPRPLWERHLAPDARNRVPIVARCLVAIDRDARRVLLVDTGVGERWDPQHADIYALDRAGLGLEAGLARLGLARDDVTDVLLTHLHFDHAGGITRLGPSGALELSFPRATHHLQRRAWQWAHAPSERDVAAFRPDDFEPLGHTDRLHLVEGEVELFPDVELIVSEGHAVGMQLPRFHDGATHVTFCGDLIPTHAHLRPSWVSAYDQRPVTSVEEKKVLVAEALEDGAVLAFGHDAQMDGCRLREEEGGPVFSEALAL
jgi:glyoxylase-like metal-dependent hydrolase (beta-lactamase superfamily II)